MSAPDPMLLKAINTHQAGRTAEAKVMYERILRRRPHDADALNFLGMLEFQRGERARGIKLLQRSVQSVPGNPHAWLNLGNMMMGVGETEAGADAYQRATDLAPDLWQAWLNRGTCLRRLRRFEEAMDCLKMSISLKPEHDAAYEKLGMILYRGGKTEELVKLYRGWVEYNPDNPTARHMYAAVMGDQMPDRASDDFVRTAFDNFAESFDDNLRDLQYRAPELLADALARHNRPLDDSAKKPDILDAGAGTGLCGPLLRERAGTLVGVDLSPGMLKLARDRRLYDELVVGELCAFMRSRPAAFDIVLSADTLVYFGALEEALAAAATCLRPGGLLAFTVERLETTDPAATFTMGVHGRYLHTRDYLRTALTAARFDTHEIAPVVLRTELGADVHGYAVVASAS